MALPRGTRLGPYAVSALIGKGGMGEVYRATDTNLKRDVALKVLPDAVAGDKARLARFQREAETLAVLNHPHIASVHGLEKSGGVSALVMELVEGDDLAALLARGPLPLDEALTIARQVAQALEAAHEHGIVHRDLKPANIKVRTDGTVKVLDFGLAKALGPADAGAAEGHRAEIAVTASALTDEGVVLGTAAYMSPEQAKGRPVDRRADLWAFGAVLYEMLTGRRAFTGETATDTIVAVVSKAPDWSLLPAGTPARVRALLGWCLEKDRAHRLDSAAAVQLEIAEAAASAASEGMAPPPVRVARRGPAWFAAGAATAATAAALLGFNLRAMPASTATVTRLTLVPPANLPIVPFGLDRDIALAPDGSFLVYRTSQERLAIRRLDQLDAAVVSGAVRARSPFVSPDGRWIGYADGTATLYKVAVAGGAPVEVARLPGTMRGATWIDDETIVLSTQNPFGLWRVAATGGALVAVGGAPQSPNEEGLLFPQAVPGGRAVLATLGQRTVVVDLDTGGRTDVLADGVDARYVPTGHLVYLSGDGLSAVRFDVSRRAVVGDPVRVIDRLAITTSRTAYAAVAPSGLLVYGPDTEGAGTARRTLVWVDRRGVETPIATPTRAYTSPRLSPDGSRAAVDIRDVNQDVWVWDFKRETLTRVTPTRNSEVAPAWTPDGRHIVFARGGIVPGAYHVFSSPADGVGEETRVAGGSAPHVPTAVTPDGRTMLGYVISATSRRDLVHTSLDRTGDATAGAPDMLFGTPADEMNPGLSPDGRFVAYQSNESGRHEIYVRPYPDVTRGQWQVSTAGGTRPVWTRGGRELVYLDATNLLTAAPMDVDGQTLRPGRPVTLLKTAYAQPDLWRTYDATPDGERFLMVKDDLGAIPSMGLIVVQNWFDELRRLLPTR